MKTFLLKTESVKVQESETKFKYPGNWEVSIFLAFLTMLPYLSSLNNNFVNWDDPVFVQNNPHIRNFSSDSFHWMLTTLKWGNWSPLTWISFAVDYHLGGLDPWIYHLNNLLIHSLNTALVFLLCLRILKISNNEVEKDRKEHFGRIASFITALLFGIHPLHVEPVAWITDRIDLLCSLFFISSLIFYLDYVSQPSFKWWRYGASLGFFVAALMSKSMALSLPIVLLLLDGWPLGRIKDMRLKFLLEKVPFFLASFISGWVTIIARSETGSLADLKGIPWDYRLMNAFHSIFFYLWKAIIPTGLSALYPLLLKYTFSASNVFSALLFVLITSYFLIYWKKRLFLTVGWFYYLITLAPALGLIQVGSQAAADRYFYLPSLSPFFIFSVVLTNGLLRKDKWLVSTVVVFGSILGYATYCQAGIWKDSVSLWIHTAKSLPRNSVVTYINLGDAYKAAGGWNEALRVLNHSTDLDPNIFYAHDAKGSIYFHNGMLNEACQEFKTSVVLEPSKAWAHCQLAIVYMKTGLEDVATTETKTALNLETDDAWVHFKLGSDYFKNGMDMEAKNETLKAIQIDSKYAEAYQQLGYILERQKRYDDAITAFQKTLSLENDNINYKLNLAYAYDQARRPRDALATYLKIGH